MLYLFAPLAALTAPDGGLKPSEMLNELIPGLITLAVVGVWLTLTALGHVVPDSLNAILQVVIGFYFGQHVAAAAARGIAAQSAAATAAQGAAVAAATASAPPKVP